MSGLGADERFWAKVDRGADDECWVWTGARTRTGYGNFWLDGSYPRAHRFAYELLVGPIPAGLDLDHLCRNRLCVNPTHLEPVTRRENLRRGDSWAPALQSARAKGKAKPETHRERIAQGQRRAWQRRKEALCPV